MQDRLRNQRLVGTSLDSASDVVRWMGAVQAQDYNGARWALGLRAPGLSGATIDDDLAAGRIIRTHVLRPTWHLVVPADVRWMLALTAPRLRAAMAYGDRQSGITPDVLRRATAAIVSALSTDRLSKTELATCLDRAAINTGDSIGLGRVLHHAETDGLICSGGLRGKQQTYVLLDTVAPPAKAVARDAALALLAHRYFASHGPATVKDFAWWSGQSVADARTGIADAEPGLERLTIGGVEYWRAPPSARSPEASAPTAHLLANFDEYTVAYSERETLVEPEQQRHASAMTLLSNVIVVDGVVLGTWRRTLRRTTASIALSPFRTLTSREREAVGSAAVRYGEFLGVAVEINGGAS